MGWRNNYAEFISRYPHKRGAELGVLKGDNAAILLNSLPNLKKLYCADHWGNPDNMIAYLKAIKPYKNRVKTLWLKSTEAHIFVEDSSLDFVFIDASHMYRNVVADIVCWVPKVKEGGIISGHDYKSQHYDVKGAVDKLFPNAIINGQVWWLNKGTGKEWGKWIGV